MTDPLVQPFQTRNLTFKNRMVHAPTTMNMSDDRGYVTRQAVGAYEALAEEAALSGDWRTVLQHIARARQDTHADSSLALALDDLERDAKAQLKKRRDAESPF